mmetsp:Transcript_64858/g.140736  ORF Transcript_64858/g.140736 Transcript_64858/m.140736 type:complete len:182 (-) Transcript_64858:34-579(-)
MGGTNSTEGGPSELRDLALAEGGEEPGDDYKLDSPSSQLRYTLGGYSCCASSCCRTTDRESLERQLMSAIVNNDTDEAMRILGEGPTSLIHSRLAVPFSDGTYMCYSDGATPLHLASLLGQQPLVKVLLDMRASPSECDDRGSSALVYAERGRNTEVQLLLVRHMHRAGTIPRLMPTTSRQ